MLTDIRIPKRQIIRWTLIVGILKMGWLLFFIVARNPEWPAHEVVKGVALSSGDYEQYYGPLENFVAGNGYTSTCRMPGLLPVYTPLRWIMSADNAQVSIIFLQCLADILACILLAILAVRITGKQSLFVITALLYGISTFVSVRSNYLLSDSFSVSFLVISMYMLSCAILGRGNKYLWLTGVFIAWSVFLRPVGILAYGCVGLVLIYHNKKNLVALPKLLLPVLLPGIVSIAAWTYRNEQVYGKRVYLQSPTEECFSQYTPQQQSVAAMLITMGEDFQKWSPGSGSEWFFIKKEEDTSHPFLPNDFTSAYNIDSLRILRSELRQFNTEENDSIKTHLGNEILRKTAAYSVSYKKERALRYYLINRLQFIRMFMFPSRLDDLPLPASSNMNIFQKATKAGSFLLLLLVNGLALFGAGYYLLSGNMRLVMWSSFAFAFAFGLGIIGFIEQRYLTPAYPMFCVLAATVVALIAERFNQRKHASN